MLRRLGPIDLTLVTIGGIIGSGIFRVPAVVAQRVHAPWSILLCWIAGAIVAMLAAFVFAELAERHPQGGGQYAYLRDAFHPWIAFVFGWTLLFAIDSGGTAAAAVLFAGYLQPLTGLSSDTHLTAAATIAAFAAINCFGVRQGSAWQNVLVLLKLAALAVLIVGGFAAHPVAAVAGPSPAAPAWSLGALGFAMLPVLFAYNGFQGATYVTGEARDPHRTIPLGIVLGVAAVAAVYVAVNAGALRVLGPAALAATQAPAADVMRAALGEAGARFISVAIALSTLGFISTRILVGPRIYHQMADDGIFFRRLAWLHPKTRAPVFAILLEGTIAITVAVTGTFAQIVNFVVLPQWTFVLLAAGALFVFRKRDAGKPPPAFRVPGHPFSTAALVLVLIGILTAELLVAPRDMLFGAIIMATGAAYFFCARFVTARAR